MRLLWLTPEVPEPRGSGGAIRAYHLLHGLVERGVDLTVVAPAYPRQAESAHAALGEKLDLRLAMRRRSQIAEGLVAIARDPLLVPAAARLPWLGWQARAFWPQLAAIVRGVVDDVSFEGVVVEHDFAIAWAHRLPVALPVGLAFQNAYWTYYEGLGGVVSAVEARRFRAHVARFAPRLSHGWAVSQPDREAIARVVPELQVDLVPNGIDAARLAHVTGEPEANQLLFTGTLDYRPNAEAVAWFAAEVLPRIRARIPQARLTVVGRNAPREIEALASDPAIDVTGWVEDLAPYQRAATVAIAPLRSGGGTKLKVLEALGAGRPLVATSVAASGIDVTDGVHLLVRDDPQSFAAGVVELLLDRPRARSLADAGRALVAARYDWGVLSDAMHASLLRWVG